MAGGLIQGISDQYYYNLWSTDPGLAARRAGAAGGQNATYGAIGTVGSVAIIGGVAWAAGIATPPGWVFTAGAAVIATGVGLADHYWLDDAIHKWWFEGIDDNTLE